MTAATGTLELRLTKSRVWRLAAPAPSPEAPFAAAGARRQTHDVGGAVLTVSDESGAHGCWGPIPPDLAKEARSLADGLVGRPLEEPGDVVSVTREADRHAHTGRTCAAAGALELACWDLLGQRHGVPVWRLLTAEPKRTEVPIYATCFGIELGSEAGVELAGRLGDAGLVQKWRPASGPESRLAYARTAAALPAGEALLSLDFGGRLSARETSAHCREAGVDFAWVEEAAPAGELMSLRDEAFPCRLAAGERCYTEDELHLLTHAGIAIWQPDAVFCGGLRRYLRSAELALEAGADLLPHGGGLLVALHAAAIAEPVPVIEYHLLLEPRRQAHLAARVFPTAEATLQLPQLPGWHGEPSWDVLRP